MDETGRGGCLNQQQYDVVVRFLAHGHFPSKRELMEAKFASQEDSARPRPFRKFKSWMQRLLYRESENALIHLPTGKVVVPKERFVQIIVENHCELGGHLNAYATMRKIQKTYTFGRRNFGMSEDLVRSVIRNCPNCERPINARQGIPLDKEGLHPIAKACKQNDEEKMCETQRKPDTVLSNTSTGASAATNQDVPTTAQTTDNDNQKGQPMEVNKTDDKRNKTDVKQSHPIIHSSLLSQLMTTRPGQRTNTGLSTSSSVPVPLLCPINAPMIPLLSIAQTAKQESLAIGASNTAKQVSTAQTKLTSAIASKLIDINSNLGSWMAQNMHNVGYYVKVPNSSLPSGFSLSFVTAPLMHLGTSTLCSPSTASVPTPSPLPPLLRPMDETARNKHPNSSEKTEESHPQAKTAISKMATATTQSRDILGKIPTPTKIAIPSLANSTMQSKSLPPIKPKEETELGKALLKPASNRAGSSNVLSTPPKNPKKVTKKNPSSGVKRKLKLKLEKMNRKVNSGGKQKKLASLKPGKMGSESNSNKKNDKEEVDKLDDANKNPLCETSKKKKIIVVNPEKMRKILKNSLNVHMNINFKGKCNVNFHNEASGITTSFLVDDGQNTSITSKNVASNSNEGTSAKVDFQSKDIKQEMLDYPGKIKQEHCLKNKSGVTEGQQNAQQTKTDSDDMNQKTENLNDGDDNFTQDMRSLVGSTSAKSSDKAITQSLFLDPGPVPSPTIWTFSEDMLAEKNCYGRLLIAIQDMRMDVMKSILFDHHAMDRLKKKICYAETLIRKHKEDRCSD
ncbi:uncharacterized protein LOC133205223 [Saccostrea echinata]|uniref:uncharacterized protein LOC133205223 n=1 Tax=Saccostrea echinata TaxID=191078 RepID=UPI002A82A184|nr:uncharacterized protein LOC133205223 [Saccostrea echinata]